MRRTGLLLISVLTVVPGFAGERVPLRDEPVRKEDAPPPVTPSSLPSIGGTWVSQGPGPILDGQTEGITNGHVIGAVQTIVAHPTNADVAWIGAVNGGIWKTTNATNASPTWTASGDAFTSLSIGAMNLDPTDGTHNTLVAAFGRFSSFGGVGGPRGGLLRTTNGGTNWTQLNPATLSGKNMNGVVARGATIVVSVNFADSFTCGNIGIFRSIDTGSSFSIVSGAVGSGLPAGRAFDVAGDPSNNAVLYTAIRDGAACTGTNGVYRSADTGATWTKVSDAAMDSLMSNASSPANARIAVGASGQVFVAIVDANEQLSGLFRSATGTGTWTQLDTPSTNEGGSPIGAHPTKKPGGQGNIHLSIAADPTDANIVYIGGDRQPLNGDGSASTPNSIGATNYTGRLFRVNASAGAGAQSTPLTHCQTATAACNSTISTSSNSSPHADSRRMVFDANGNILEGDDGGIFRRTNPRTTGDWFSLNGNVRVNEMRDVAYDRVSNMIISGNQDTGTAEQTAVDGITWTEVTQGDGGDVAVDDFTSGTQSTRYSSFQGLGNFLRRGVNSSGVATSFTNPALTVTGGGPAFVGQFATPVEVNVIDGTRILFAGDNDLYESLDRGDTITALGFSDGVLPADENAVNAIVFGGRSGGIDNVNLIYAICSTGPTVGGANVFVRTAGSGAPVETVDPTGATALRDIAVDPTEWQTAFVVDSSGKVFTTTNTGAAWTNITGNLASGSTDLRTILFVPGSPDAVIVGGVNGVFRMAMDDVGNWKQFGTGLSNAPVWDLDYDATDDTLIAGTMGRGAWKLNPVGNLGPIPTLSINDVAVSEGNAGTTNATFTVTLSAASGVPVSVSYATADGSASTGNATFSNTATVFIPIGPGNASPYPLNVTVSGMTGTITNVTATLTGFSHSFRRDVDVLLVGPQGQSVVLMSDAGGANTATNLNLTFDDSAAAPIATGSPSGTYQPTNIADGEGSDTYSSPAPPSGYGAALSVFNGTAPGGTWSLYVVDDFVGDAGSISGGLSLTISTTGGDYVASSGTVDFDPGETSQPLVVLVNGDAVVESNETFFVNLSLASNATILDGQGQGTITNDDGVVLSPPTNTVATATAPTSVNITWTASAGATSYRVYRKNSIGGLFSLVGSPVGTSFDDPTASSGTAYFFMVRAFNGTESGDSNLDLATTVIFTDPTLSTATLVKLAHFTELLTAVNAMLTFAGESTISFTAPTPTTSVTVRAQHVLDLRAGLDDARSTLALSALGYTDPSLVAGTTGVKSAHITDLRNGVK